MFCTDQMGPGSSEMRGTRGGKEGRPTSGAHAAAAQGCPRGPHPGEGLRGAVRPGDHRPRQQRPGHVLRPVRQQGGPADGRARGPALLPQGAPATRAHAGRPCGGAALCLQPRAVHPHRRAPRSLPRDGGRPDGGPVAAGIPQDDRRSRPRRREGNALAQPRGFGARGSGRPVRRWWTLRPPDVVVGGAGPPQRRGGQREPAAARHSHGDSRRRLSGPSSPRRFSRSRLAAARSQSGEGLRYPGGEDCPVMRRYFICTVLLASLPLAVAAEEAVAPLPSASPATEPSPAVAPAPKVVPERWAPNDQRRTLRSYGTNLAYNFLGVVTPGNRRPLLVTAALTAPA